MIKDLLVKELRKAADNIESGKCDINADDAIEMMSMMSNVSMSQSESARFLNMNETTFRKRVENGKIPKGHKRRGLTERLWYLGELKQLLKS